MSRSQRPWYALLSAVVFFKTSYCFLEMRLWPWRAERTRSRLQARDSARARSYITRRGHAVHVLACATEYRQETAILQRSASRNGCWTEQVRFLSFTDLTSIQAQKIGNSRLFSNIFQHLPQSLLQIQRVLLASRLPSPCFQGFRFHTVGLGEPWRGFATKRLAVLFV